MPENRAPKATRSPVSWHLKLLGTAHVQRNGQALDALERRTVALLAYLALEGPVTRSKVAGFLWPDSTEDAARANLRQRLKRLREALGEELILASDQSLRLRPDVNVDIVSLESLAFTGEFDALLRLSGEALGGHDYDDLPDVEVWVLALRERLEAARRAALTALSARAEQAGAYTSALEYAQRLLETEAVSEEAHRRVMRLHHLLGNRAAALRAYQQCVDTLQRELSVEPLPATLELAQLIARGASLPDQPAALTPVLPLSIQRPPLLVGREREWARLEAAWQARQAIFIAGPPGVGKTRLMLDFALSKGAIAALEGRAGDAGVPYATHARSFKAILGQHPDLVFAPWMRRELARLDPTLEPDAPPAPLEAEAQKLRFFEAVAQTVRLVAERGVNTIVLDDLQFMDAASFELGQFLVPASFGEARGWPRSISAFRSGELSATAQAQLEHLLESGAAALIELGSLSATDTGTLLSSIAEIADLERLAAPLMRYTGGNPLFIVETVKHLFETDQLGGDFPLRLPPSGQVAALIQRRLERLSPTALRVAQVAAIAGTDFSLELGARVLGVDALQSIPAITELEGAQVMRNETFAHDLILEATLLGLPNTVRALLHGRVAAQLEAGELGKPSTAPARIAHHWLEAGDETKAVPHLIAAARAAEAAYRFPEAIAAFEQVGDVQRSQGRRREAFEAYLAARTLLRHADTGAHLESLIERLLELAQTPDQLALAWNASAELAYERGDYLEAERMARTGLTHALESGDERRRAELASTIAGSIWQQGRREEAAQAFEEVCAFFERAALEPELSDALNNLAFACDTLDRYAEARAHYRRALELSERLGMKQQQIIVLNNLSFNLRSVGRCREAIPLLEAACVLVNEIEGDVDGQRRNLFHLGSAWFERSDYRRGFALLDQALQISRANKMSYSFMLARLVGAYLDVGQDDACERLLSEVEGQPATLGSRAIFRRTLARLRQRQGRSDEALELFAEAEAILGADISRTERARSGLLKFTVLSPEAGLGLSHEILETARTLELGGVRVAAHARIAQGSLALNRPEPALEHASAAVSLLEQFDPDSLSHAEILWTHHRALEANQLPAARAALKCALDWVVEIADQRVPPEYRESFLSSNPINAAILKAARAAGLIAASI